MGLKVLDDDPAILQSLAFELAVGSEISVDEFRQKRIA